MEASPRRIEVGRVINESFTLYGENAAALMGSAFVVFSIVGIAQALLDEAGGWVLSLVASIIVIAGQALFTGFVVRLVADARGTGAHRMTIGELFSVGGETVWRLIANGILKGIAIAIGFVLLIVPGLILLTIWSVTSPSIVVERRGIFEAFGRSSELVRGNGWQVFGAILVAFLIAFGITAALIAIGAVIGVVGVIILAILAGVITAPIPALVASILFFDLGGESGLPTATPTAAPAV
jgi:hypothetical protein